MKQSAIIFITVLITINCQSTNNSKSLPNHLSVVEKQITAYNSRNIDNFLDCYSEDIIIEDANGNIIASCHDQIRGMYQQLFSKSPDLHAQIEARFAVGNYVFDKENVSGFIMKSFPVEFKCGIVYRVKNNKIEYVQMIM